MNKDELLEAFRLLSPEDQKAVRAEISDAGSGCMPPGMAEHMKSMMETMQTGGNPMAACCEAMKKTPPAEEAGPCGC